MSIEKFSGYLYAVLAAAAYGTNPAFAIPLYEHGMNPNTVLLFRYLMGLPLLALIMMIRSIPFKLNKNLVGFTFILGILMALSSLTLFESYNYMNSGVASTLLFVYPIMVAMIMVFFFHEKIKISLYLCLVIMITGLILLMKPEKDEPLSLFGCTLVMISALTYAIYIVCVNVSPKVKRIPTTQLLFYVLTFGSLVFIVMFAAGSSFTWPSRGYDWINLFSLAVIPTVLSLAFTTRAIQLIGSTPTAILGALEPVTAVILSVIILNQNLSINEVIGGVLILVAALIIISNDSLSHLLLHIRKMFPKRKIKNQ